MTLRALVSSPWFRRLAWGLGALLALWALAWAAVPALAKSQAQSRLGELLGRQVTVGSIVFSPWSLELTVRDLAVATADGKGVQFSLDRVYVDAEAQSLFRLAPVIDAVTVDAPKVQLTHLGDGRYDIDDILERLNKPDDTPAGPTPQFAVYNLTLNQGSVDYADRARGAERLHTLRDLQISLPFLSSFDSKRDVLVAPRLAFVLNGSRFDTQAEGTPFAQSRKGDAALTVRQLDLAPYLPYLPANLPVKPQSAVVDADIQLGFVQSPQTAVTLSGTVTVSRLAVQDTKGKPLFSADSLQVGLADVRPLERSVKLSGITLNAPVLNLVRAADGSLNLLPPGPAKSSAPKKIAARADSASASAPKDAETPAPTPWALQLDTLTLKDASVDWTDQVTAPTTRLGLRDFQATVSKLQWPMKEAATLDLKARLQSLAAGTKAPAAQLSLQGEGTFGAGKAEASVSDFGLGLVSGYVSPYLVPSLRGQADTRLNLAWNGERQTAVVQKLALRDVALVGDKPAAEPRVNGNNNGPSSGDMPQFKLLELSDVRVDTQSRSATVGKVLLQKPSTGVRRDAEGRWMFESWLKPNETADTKAVVAKSPAPWKLSLGELKLEEGHVVFSDRLPARPVRLELSGLQVQAKNIQPDGKKPMPLQVAAKLKSGQADAGSLRYTGNVMWDPVVAQGEVDIADLPAHALLGYAGLGLNLDVLRADTSFKGQVRFAALANGPQVSVKGDAALEDFRANTTGKGAESLGEELLSWKALNVPGIDFQMAPGTATQVQVREAALSDFYARLIVNPQGRLNLQDLGQSAPPAAPASAAAPAAEASATRTASASPAAIIQMGPISMVNGRVLFTDRFIQPNYTANLTDLTGKLSRFSNQPTGGVVQLADLELRGRAEGTASLEILGKLNPLAQPLALDVKGLVRDLELSPLSPYAVKYAGYGIERGKLSVDVHYIVQPDGQLTAANKLVLNQLSFGDKVDGAPTSLPVKLAVALLADRNGVINLDLPISGSLNDPQFRVGPVIWQVITNLVTKAITAPFSLLANAFGGSGGAELSSVVFAPGSPGLSDSARAGLDKVAQALQDRPALKLTVVGSANLEAERDAAKREKLRALLLAEKRRTTSAQGKDAATVTSYSTEEMPVLLRAVYRRSDISKPRNLVGLTKDIAVADMESLLLANLSANEDDIRNLALQRAVVVKEYLAGKNLAAERLFLGAVKTGGTAADAKPQAELEIGG
ncbi:MAG: DUF748 domain-containing protein [Rhodoferax sp.]|uniref:DUF748 domain-containing protein n=1 Tax=Rhodoferax sp. TaxID=50421 RepID=UPI002ACEBD30|nr:DUF748 domain-containing protein [Rhodoferax sp.]MDZ7891240.1 DUF748 domain-containing protein [Rhodoferax sp.]